LLLLFARVDKTIKVKKTLAKKNIISIQYHIAKDSRCSINPTEVTVVFVKSIAFSCYYVAFQRLFLYIERIIDFISFRRMPLLKSQKVDLAQTYLTKLQKGLNVTLLAFDKIPVNEVNKFRMDVADAQ
jgi:hypothetical protein